MLPPAPSAHPAQPAESSQSESTLTQQLITPDTTPEPAQPISTANSAPAPPENRSDFDAQNILPEGSKRSRKTPRRQIYATALAQAAELTPFHTAFALGREKEAKFEGLHRDTLPAEPRTWRQMTKHKFAAEFAMAADKEIQELARRDIYKWVKKEAVTAMLLPLLWVFKYKFDTDGYLMKFKARLYVQGDLQSTEQNMYAATLAICMFKALMAIAATFDLKIHQYDAINAFINAKLDKQIYYTPPEGYKRLNQSWQLLWALYSLK